MERAFQARSNSGRSGVSFTPQSTIGNASSNQSIQSHENSNLSRSIFSKTDMYTGIRPEKEA
jgi:hypothetical protein